MCYSVKEQGIKSFYVQCSNRPFTTLKKHFEKYLYLLAFFLELAEMIEVSGGLSHCA